MSQGPANPRVEESFRQLRLRVRELSTLCTAINGAAEPARIWRRIVRSSQLLLDCDGCTYYRVAGRTLVPEVVLSRSLGLVMGAEDGNKVNMPVLQLELPEGVTSNPPMAVRAALSGEIINVADITRGHGYSESRTRAFDEQMGYKTRSIMTVPVSHRGGPVTGVLQFINIRQLDGTPGEFGSEQEDTARALAALLAIAENLA